MLDILCRVGAKEPWLAAQNSQIKEIRPNAAALSAR
jgi:hypothetical protein